MRNEHGLAGSGWLVWVGLWGGGGVTMIVCVCCGAVMVAVG